MTEKEKSELDEKQACNFARTQDRMPFELHRIANDARSAHEPLIQANLWPTRLKSNACNSSPSAHLANIQVVDKDDRVANLHSTGKMCRQLSERYNRKSVASITVACNAAGHAHPV